jgi:hypothetical protein
LGCSCVGCCNEWITHLGETSTNWHLLCFDTAC